MKDNIMVSICCITYNQEKYIKEAIESFIKQKTNFNYEIIIHDDASTDRTKSIIERYYKKYPNKIVPIYEDINQYSINPNNVMKIIFEKARGKYIVICDGDDGFCGNKKLQIQYDFMEKNLGYVMCSHNTKVINDKNEVLDYIKPYAEGDIDINNFFSIRSSMHTSSMFIRKKYIDSLPDFFYKSTVGDLPLKLYLFSEGKIYHFNNVYSFYRMNALNSWSEAQKKDKEKKYNNFINEINTYENFNKYTKNSFNNLVTDRILKISFEYYKSINNLKEIKKDKYKYLYKNLSIKEKLKLVVKNTKIYKKIRRQ